MFPRVLKHSGTVVCLSFCVYVPFGSKILSKSLSQKSAVCLNLIEKCGREVFQS